MKNIKFLIKLKKEGKIGTIEPNEEIKIYKNKFVNLLK